MRFPVRCRAIEFSDFERITSWTRQLQIDEGAPVMESEAISDRLRRWLESDYDAVIFELETIPIGDALFRSTDPELKAPDGIYLRQFFISPEYRRRGAGTAAFQEYVAQAVRGRRLVLEVLESNRIGQSFWRSLGLIPYSSTLELPPTTSA